TLDPRPSTLDPRPSTLDPRPSTLDPRPQTLDPRLWAPKTLDPQPVGGPRVSRGGRRSSRRCAGSPALHPGSANNGKLIFLVYTYTYIHIY
ncbi:hypothetical protein T484DRAFT_1644280, partial [Baffinella frigidus]